MKTKDWKSVVGCEMKSGVFDLRSESRTFTSHPPKSLLVLKTDKLSKMATDSNNQILKDIGKIQVRGNV
jgi:hypothetical protein